MTDRTLDQRLAALEARLGRLESLLAALGDRPARGAPSLEEAKDEIRAWVTEYVSLRLQQLVPETCAHPEREADAGVTEGPVLPGTRWVSVGGALALHQEAAAQRVLVDDLPGTVALHAGGEAGPLGPRRDAIERQVSERIGLVGQARVAGEARKLEVDVLVAGQFPGSGKPGPIAFPDPDDVKEIIKKIQVIDLPTLVQLKLAARRYRDFGDVVELIRFNNLDESFQDQLHSSVRQDYTECLEEKRREDEYEERHG